MSLSSLSNLTKPMSWPDIARLPELVKAGFGRAGFVEPLNIFGEAVYIKATGAQTGGLWSMIEQVTPAAGGPPVHSHGREDEGFFILEGEYLFLVGEDRIKAYPGDFLWAPRNVPHTFLNIGSGTARATVVMSPPGMENFFSEIAAISGPPEPEEIGRIFAKYGLEVLGPPLTL